MPQEIKKHWQPVPQVMQYICDSLSRSQSILTKAQKVLDVGPGLTPFPAATHFVDKYRGDHFVEELPDSNFTIHDMTATEASPFSDKFFDFVFCRHMLEDVAEPMRVCREISRIGMAGYCETPSPLAELSRDVDCDSPSIFRGYLHHRYVIWKENDTLVFLPKLPIIELFKIEKIDRDYRPLLADNFNWNSYFFWKGEIKCLYVDGIDLRREYFPKLLDAVEHGLKNAEETKTIVYNGNRSQG